MRPLLLLPLLAILHCRKAEPPPVVRPPPAPVVVDAGPPEPPPPPAPETLFDRLGGPDGVGAVVDLLLASFATDRRVSKVFEKTLKDPSKLAHLRSALIEQICTLSEGPCTYAGDMKKVHAPFRITTVQWNAFLEDFGLALKARGVAEDDQSILIVRLGAMRADILGRR
ncbi:MAG: group 1 truncated hemoglobin [Myxococcales bacterium]